MNLVKLLQTKKTVFSIKDLQKILKANSLQTIRTYTLRAKKKWILENIYYGLWKLIWRETDLFELACKIHKNSYISFETVLKKEWVIFQHYWENIFLASDKSLEKQAVWKVFKSFKLKTSILLNPIWIKHTWNYSIASKERAICDKLYLNSNYFFDNLENVDFEKLLEISKIYNKRVELEVIELIKQNNN